MPDFNSVHASLLQKYIDYKRNLGYKFNYDSIFSQFDRFLCDHQYLHIELSRNICRKWEEKRPNQAESYRYMRIGLVHNYALYLRKLGYSTHLPERQFEYKTTFTPYIFSRQEIKGFFYHCDQLTGKESPAYPAIFRLLYGCGLRRHEALCLKVEDVDFKSNTVIIRDSKNNSERMVPMSISTANVMSGYLSYRNKNKEPKSYFFQGRHGGRISNNALYHQFRLALERAGIPHRGKGFGPRMHDFRHTFSVYTLSNLASQGIDLYCVLPILSKYLGHKSVSATESYARITAELFPEIMEGVNKTCAFIFPEVDDV